LKKIGRALSRPIHLTSYVFRHTWATNALRKQVPLSIISQALGHTSEKTTRFYLASLEQSELNRANARVTEEVDLLLAAG
jgi:integrase